MGGISQLAGLLVIEKLAKRAGGHEEGDYYIRQQFEKSFHTPIIHDQPIFRKPILPNRR